MPARSAALLFAALLPLSAAAQDGLLTAADPFGIARAMQKIGYRAELKTDGAGDPMIVSGAAGFEFQIFFYGCDDGRGCSSMQFAAGFDLAEPLSLSVVNEWNRTRRFGAAYLDEEGDPFLQYDLTTTGGLTEENFADAVDWWRVALDRYADHVGMR